MMTREEHKGFNALIGPVDGRRGVSRFWGLFQNREFKTREEQEYAADNVDWLRESFGVRKQEACGFVGCTPYEYHKWRRLVEETKAEYRRKEVLKAELIAMASEVPFKPNGFFQRSEGGAA